MQPVVLLLLAQAAQPAVPRTNKEASAVFVWVIALIVVIMVGGVLVMWLRRKILMAEAASDQEGGLMESLRKMRDSGQMSQEEFDATRKAMLSRMTRHTHPPGPTPAKPKGDRGESR